LLSLVSLALTLGGASVAFWLVLQRRKVVSAFGGTGSAAAIIGFALVTNLAAIVAPERGSLIMGVSAFLLLAWMAVSSSPRSLLGPSDSWLRVSWLASGLLILWCFAVDSLVGHGVYGSRFMAYAAAAVLFAAVGLMSGRIRVGASALMYTGLCLLSALTIPTYWAPDSWRRCTAGDLEKCSIAGALFKSFYDSENYIAILASFAFVACLGATRGAVRLAIGSFCLLVIISTGSRSSFLGIGAAGLWQLGALVLERRRRRFHVPIGICLSVAVTAVGLATYLMWSASPGTLSNRGRIWMSARDYLSEMAITGVGVSKWYFLREIGDSPQHFFHSGYVAVLFSGGFIALGAWTLWATALLRGAVHDGRAFSAKGPLVLLLVYSLTEVVWNPISVDGLSWIFVALMLTQSAELGQSPDRPGKDGPILSGTTGALERPKVPGGTNRQRLGVELSRRKVLRAGLVQQGQRQ
jgi:hypothetical protein